MHLRDADDLTIKSSQVNIFKNICLKAAFIKRAMYSYKQPFQVS